MLYHNILNSDEGRLVKRVVAEQEREGEEGTWFASVSKCLQQLKMDTSMVKNSSKSDMFEINTQETLQKSSIKGQKSSQKVTKDIHEFFPAEVQSDSNTSQISKVSSGFVDLVKKVTNTKCESPLKQQQQDDVHVHARVNSLVNNIEWQI